MAELDTDTDAACVARLIEGRCSRLAGLGVDLDALRPFAARLEAEPEYAQLRAWAGACGREVHELLVLDGGVFEVLTGAQIERSLGLYVDGPRGPVLGGAWSLVGDEADAVGLRPVVLGEDRERPAWVFGLPGSFGLAGIAAAGHVALANLLRPQQPGPGLPGSVVLRRLLAAPRLDAARTTIVATDLADGRNWMLSDGLEFLGFEQLGAERILTRVGRKTGHVHANHCFDPSLRQREAKPRSPLSFRRLELASTLYVQRRPDCAESMLAYLAEVEAAAFAEVSERAGVALAVELETGVALWRRRDDGAIERSEFATPLAVARGE